VSSDRVSDLLFLLSLSGLAAGCSKGVSGNNGAPFGSLPMPNDDETDTEPDGPVEDDDRDGSTSGSDSSITTDPSGPGTSGPAETTTGLSGPGSTGFPEGSSSGASGPATTTGMSSDSSSTGNACADYGYWAADCYGYDDGQAFCYYVIDYHDYYYGPGCAAAVEEYFACVSTQNCGMIGCNAESTAIQNSC
jgi:hypothetical protein